MHKQFIKVQMKGGLGGDSLGTIHLPIKMKEAFIKSYFESGTVKMLYLYIDGKEITDGKNYNPFYVKPECSK